MSFVYFMLLCCNTEMNSDVKEITEELPISSVADTTITEFTEFITDNNKEQKEELFEVAQELVLDQMEEASTRPIDEVAIAEIVQESTEMLSLATPQSSTKREKTQEETIILMVADDDSDLCLHDAKSDVVSEEEIKVRRDVKFIEHVAVDDTNEEIKDIPREMSLQEEQTIEIVQKAIEEFTELTVSSPQLATHETDELRRHIEQETYAEEMPSVENLLMLEVSCKRFTGVESSTINIEVQQLRHIVSPLNDADEIELVIPMVARTETAIDEKALESVDSSVDADKSAFVTNAEKEAYLKPELQENEGLDTPAKPTVSFEETVSTVESDIEASRSGQLPYEEKLEEMKSHKHQREMEKENLEQLPEELVTTEEDLNEIEANAFIVVELPEDSQPFVTVKCAAPLLRELDETKVHEKEVASALQSEMGEDATARIAVVAEAVEKVFAAETEEKDDKSAETVEKPLIQEPKSEKAEQETKTLLTDFSTGTETFATRPQEETARVIQCTETVYDEQRKSEFEILLPTNEAFSSHPTSADKVEDNLMHVEVMLPEVDERGVKAAEETRHVQLDVKSQALGSTQVEMMLPVNEDEAYDSATICVEEDTEIRKPLRCKILSEAVSETVPMSAEILQVKMVSVRLEFEDSDAVDMTPENSIVKNTAAAANIVGIFSAVIMTPKITEEERSVLSNWTDIETGGDDKLIGTLRPAVYEKEFLLNESLKLPASSPEKIVIVMKEDMEHAELTAVCSSEKVTARHLLKEIHDVEISKKRETTKPVINNVTIGGVVFFSCSSEHDVDLLVFRQILDEGELARIAADEMATTFSHFEGELMTELLEVDITYGEQTDTKSFVAAEPLCKARSETESTPLVSGNDVATTALSATEKTRDSAVTIQYTREYVFDETKASEIVFPTLPDDDSVLGVPVFVDETAVGDDTTREMVDDVILQLHKPPATASIPSRAKTDFEVVEVMPEMSGAKCTVSESVQSELYVPYCSSVIVLSRDTNAQTDAVVQRSSESKVDTFAVDLTHISETRSSGQDECTLSLNENILCDSLTVVFPEYVESSLVGNQPSSGDTETEVIDLPEQSLLSGGFLPTVAEKNELQKDDNVEQSQAVQVESAMIQMRFWDVDDTMTLRPQKPEFLETISLEENRTDDSVRTDEKILHGLFNREDPMTRSPVLAARSDDVRPMNTDAYDSEVLSDTHAVWKKDDDDAVSDGMEIDTIWECNKPDESEEDVMQLSTVDVSLCDGTLVQVVHAADVCITTVLAAVDVCDEAAVSHSEKSLKLDGGNVQTECPDDWQLQDDVTPGAVQKTSESDCSALESAVIVERATSTSVESLGDAQTQLFERPGTPHMENEREVEKLIISCEASKPIAADCGEESETTDVCEAVNTEATLCQPTTDDSQRQEPESAQSDETSISEPRKEDEVKSAVGLPWNLLFADLLSDDGTTSVTLSGHVGKEDARSQGEEVEREKPAVERGTVSDDRSTASSGAASKSSVVTRKVQRVGADGRVVERVKSEEVPMSFGPTSLAPYFFGVGTDMPSPPDFSPQSDDRLSTSVKVYTDTVEGEPWTERRVEEIQETRSDGATVTRKVVRVRKRRTIIKHIVIEGPEFEEIVLDEPATAAEASRTEATAGDLNVEGHSQSSVDKHRRESSASSNRQSDVDPAAKQMPTEAMRCEDISHTELTEADHRELEQRFSYVKEKTDEAGFDIGSGVDNKDMTPSLPASLELSHAGVSSQEARHYGDVWECFPPSDGGSVGDGGTGLDNVESASSCGDFATGILCYSQPYCRIAVLFVEFFTLCNN